MIWNGKWFRQIAGRKLISETAVSIEVVVPVTYRSPAGSIVMPLAMSVPFPDRYEEYTNCAEVKRQLRHKHVRAGARRS